MKIDSLTPTLATLEELGRRLAHIRKQRGLSQESLAETAGVGVATLRRIEDGNDARIGSWLRLLKALQFDATVDQLLPENYRSPMADVRRARKRTGDSDAGPDFVWEDERR